MNIYGWDTVTALSVDEVNKSLEANRSKLIQEFKVSGQTLSGTYTLQGIFGAWRIVQGGSGNLLRLEVPLTAGTIQAAGGKPIDVAGADTVVDVSLDLLPAAAGNAQNLVFALHKAAQFGDTPQPGAVTPVAFNAPAAVSAALGPVGTRLVLDAVAQALAADAAAVSYVFASVNLVPPSANSWLTPVRSAYVYQEVVGGGAYLAILSTLTARDTSQLQHSVDPELFAGGGNAAFAISQDVFLADVVAPVLPQAFGGGSNAGCFGYDAGRHLITAAHSFGCSQVKAGAIWYTPNVTALKIGVVGGSLAMSVNGNCDLKAEISMDWWITSQYPLRFDPATQRISFAGDPNSRSGHTTHIPWWYLAGGIFAEAVTQVVVSVISDSLSSDLSSRLGSVGLANIAAQTVAWQGMRQFAVTSARLDGALLLSGNAA